MIQTSHLTQSQAARYINCSKQTVGRNSLYNQPLEAIKVLGVWMIPVEKIIKFKKEWETKNG